MRNRAASGHGPAYRQEPGLKGSLRRAATAQPALDPRLLANPAPAVPTQNSTEAYKEIPEGEIYLVPVRLDRCEIPQAIAHLHRVDAFEPAGVDRLVSSLKSRLPASTPKHRVLRFYQYISDAKVDMLLSQLGLTGVPEDRALRCELVEEHLRRTEIVGTLDVPQGWFGGTMDMRWGPYWPDAPPDSRYAVWFAGTSGRSAIFLGGSSVHLLGRQNQLTIYASDLPGVLEALLRESSMPESPEGSVSPQPLRYADGCSYALSYALRGEAEGQPSQRFEFLARLLHDCGNVQSTTGMYHVVIGSPLLIREAA